MLTEIPLIFKPELEILGGDLKESVVQVTCNQLSSKFDYCGGVLEFQAEFAQIADEAGNYYSIDELGLLGKGYWHDWLSKNRI